MEAQHRSSVPGTWWYWLLLGACAAGNDALAYWLTNQAVAASTRVGTDIGVGIVEVVLISALTGLTGRYRHRWVPLTVVCLLALMIVFWLAVLFVALITAAPDNS